MISHLHIKNIALIRDLSLELKPGLNILSGETGAGKSIIIDSINFVLGDRADRSLIRYGETAARVEMTFENIDNFDAMKELLESYGIECEDDMILVTRYMTSDRSECRINGQIVNLSTLRNVVATLVDIHSQNEHQSLMKTANHIVLLDAFDSQMEELKTEFRALVKKYREVTAKIDGYMSEDERNKRIDLLKYQIDEIEKANWSDPEEESRLTQQKIKYYNFEKIAESMSLSVQSLDNDTMGAIPSIKVAMRDLRPALKYEPELNDISARLESLSLEAEDIAFCLREKLENMAIGVNIDLVEKRLGEIKSVKRKYGSGIEEVAKFLESAKIELDMLSDAESIIKQLEADKEKTEGKIISLVNELHRRRVGISENFCKAITRNLSELGMKNSRFDVKIDFPDDILNNLNTNGADTLEFMLSPNVGEPLKPLSKIASGGEMSRFMLALKNIISEVDGIGTLIFDEIDTGISGAIAKVVACKLYDIARARQVIAITHLPQLASMADYNFLIEKKVVEEKTLTFVKELEGNEVFREIMRLSGAAENSASGLSSAKELKSWANNYKKADKM